LRPEGVYSAMQGGLYSPRQLVEQVVKVVKQFTGGRSQNDDIALVGFGRTATGVSV
jgi:serine phosphatase RsbU (regulator of sigma subunit)